jgi:hypothetical protein
MLESDKVRENRLRRTAERQGLLLRKSRRRNPHAIDYGCFWLIDRLHQAIVFPADQLCANLDHIEDWLTRSAEPHTPSAEIPPATGPQSTPAPDGAVQDHRAGHGSG